MYAIVRDGSRQYRVAEGEEIEFDRKPGEPGEKIEFTEVLVLHDGKKATIGTPTVEGAKVVGEIVGPAVGPKFRVHKYKRRKGYRVSRGHKQKYSLIKITGIVGG